MIAKTTRVVRIDEALRFCEEPATTPLSPSQARPDRTLSIELQESHERRDGVSEIGFRRAANARDAARGVFGR